MVLIDSQISMRPLSLNLLFTPVDYIFVICLMKFLPWLVGVSLRACSIICFCIVVSLLFYYSRDVIQFWAVYWDLGLDISYIKGKENKVADVLSKRI